MSIYDEIGGAPAVQAAVDDLYARVLGDRGLSPLRDDIVHAPSRLAG